MKFIIHGRDTRQIVGLVSRLLKQSANFNKQYQKVIFFPYNAKIPNIPILPRLKQQQPDYINFLNSVNMDMLLVFTTLQSFKQYQKQLIGNYDIMVGQKNGQKTHLQGKHYIGYQSNGQLAKILKSKTIIKKWYDVISKMNKRQVIQFDQNEHKSVLFA